MKQNRDVRLTASLAFGLTVGIGAVLLPLKSGPAQAGDDAGVREFIASQAPLARSVSATPVPARPTVASLPYAEALARYHFAPPPRATGLGEGASGANLASAESRFRQIRRSAASFQA